MGVLSNRLKQRSAIALALIFLFQFEGAANDAPSKMINIGFRFISPAITPGTFDASTRELWRASDKYVRIDEAPDPGNRIHGVIIINEPNTWMWNRFTNEAKHIIDPGPTFTAHAAIFPAVPSVATLEFGQEKEFFAARGARKLADDIIDGVRCAVMALEADGTQLTLYLRKPDGPPFQVSLKNPETSYSIRYEKYDADLPFDASLFDAPKGAVITDAK